VPVLRVLAPWMPPAGVQTVRALLRKLSHLTEYAVLALPWVRAFRSQRRFSLRMALWAALAVCLTCAVVDEAHQARVPGRHGSVRDVALDSLGALATLLVVRTRQRVMDARVASRRAGAPLDAARVDRGG
jgi:VanZ family protein